MRSVQLGENIPEKVALTERFLGKRDSRQIGSQPHHPTGDFSSGLCDHVFELFGLQRVDSISPFLRKQARQKIQGRGSSSCM